MLSVGAVHTVYVVPRRTVWQVHMCPKDTPPAQSLCTSTATLSCLKGFPGAPASLGQFPYHTFSLSSFCVSTATASVLLVSSGQPTQPSSWPPCHSSTTSHTDRPAVQRVGRVFLPNTQKPPNIPRGRHPPPRTPFAGPELDAPPANKCAYCVPSIHQRPAFARGGRLSLLSPDCPQFDSVPAPSRVIAPLPSTRRRRMRHGQSVQWRPATP